MYNTNINKYQPIIIFGRDFAESILSNCYPTSPEVCALTTRRNMNPEIGSFQSCCIPKTLTWLAILVKLINQLLAGNSYHKPI